MADQTDADPIRRALDEIEAAANAKRASGDISAELEASLDAEFREIAGSPAPQLDDVERNILRLRALLFEVPAPPSTSSLPGGQVLHRIVSTTVRRHNQQQSEQLKLLRDIMVDALDALDRRMTEGLDQIELRRRRSASDLRAELAELWRASGARDGAP